MPILPIHFYEKLMYINTMHNRCQVTWYKEQEGLSGEKVGVDGCVKQTELLPRNLVFMKLKVPSDSSQPRW